jgi:superfamily I DNA/RNA helicase
MATWLLPRVELTPNQLRAVEMSPHEHRVVFGPPGSGKTQVLIHRAAHLAQTYRVPPERFRVFVFTNVMKDYIQSGLNLVNLPDNTVSTFDHWCCTLYEQHVAKRLPWSKAARGFDFEQIRLSVFRLFRDTPSLQKSLEFALVDEGQDLTPQVYAILSLASRHITVFADPLQKIFDGGASEETMLRALGLQKRNVTLLEAYRNSPYVAQLASYFIPETDLRRQYLSQTFTEQKIREKPLCFIASSPDEEVEWLSAIIRQRQLMNERVGIIVPTNRQLFYLARKLEEGGIEVEKAIRNHSKSGNGGSCDFDNMVPKIATYHMAKGITFDSVLLPCLANSSFPRNSGVARQRMIFVGIARATQWVYLSIMKDKDFEEMNILSNAELNGHLTGKIGSQEKSQTKGYSKQSEDLFSVL